ncbi:hypothetical protein AQJ23_03505 [Streptomyces antibioticus]|nr:hypothetical protein [Streptomyces antibioticus]KUN29821.1 hypothetical protein AQJ23_03505 [Streptomyces antibioticus]
MRHVRRGRSDGGWPVGEPLDDTLGRHTGSPVRTVLVRHGVRESDGDLTFPVGRHAGAFGHGLCLRPDGGHGRTR